MEEYKIDKIIKDIDYEGNMLKREVNTLLTNKAMYCYNCQESTEESTKTISTACVSETPN